MQTPLLVRTDNGTGDRTLEDWDRAERIIREHYKDSDAVLRNLALGHPVRCTFATYQHRDFVEGFERKQTN